MLFEIAIIPSPTLVYVSVKFHARGFMHTNNQRQQAHTLDEMGSLKCEDVPSTRDSNVDGRFQNRCYIPHKEDAVLWVAEPESTGKMSR